MLVLTAASVWVTAHLARRYAGPGPAIAAATVLSVNPTLLEYGHYILSEAPFTLLVVAALLFDQLEDRRNAVLAVVVACAAFATRTAGMALLVALPLARLLEGSKRRSVWSAAGTMAAIGTWALYQRWAAADRPSYLQALLQRDPYAPESGTVGFGELLSRAAENMWTYVSRILPDTILGQGMWMGGAGMGVGVVVALAALVGWAIRARNRPGTPELLTVLYVGIIATWPTAWSDRRFLLPLMPLILIYAASAAWRLPHALRPWLQWVIPALVASAGMSWVARTAPDRLQCTASYAVGSPCDGAQWTSLYTAGLWAYDNTEPEAIIANGKPRLFFWHARRQGNVYPLSSDPDVVMRGLEEMGADYVLVDHVSRTAGRYLVPAIEAYGTRFELVYSGGEPPSYVFRLLPQPQTTARGMRQSGRARASRDSSVRQGGSDQGSSAVWAEVLPKDILGAEGMDGEQATR